MSHNVIKNSLITFLLILFHACSENENSVEQNKINRDFQKNISYISDGSTSAFITKAETLYPSRDSVVAAAYPELLNKIPETDYWFYRSIDNIYVPFAITREAVSYYTDLIDAYNANDGYNVQVKAKLDYTAMGEYKESYTFQGKNPLTGNDMPTVSYSQVHIITLSLSWENHCGNSCGLSFSHKRIVIFNKSGKLLDIYYDGPIPVSLL